MEILDVAYRNTLFSQLLCLIPGYIFQNLDKKHNTGRSSRIFSLKAQFIVMAFIQLAGRHSMRDAIRCLATLPNRLYHWGLKKVCRSTFSDANKSRPAAFFEDLFYEMYNLCILKAPKHKFKLNCKIFSMDSTTISLCLSLFPWAHFRKKKGGVKIHTLLDHDGHIPAFAAISDAKTHDSKMAKVLDLPKGSMVVFDRGYVGYSWFLDLCAKGISFVTRFKKNTKYKMLEHWEVEAGSGVTSDHIIEITTKNQTIQLRRVGYRDPASFDHYYFLTNNFTLDAKTIADLYKERWKIEIFFKEIKQFLKIKHFVGNSENAVRIQIFTALTIYLLLSWQKFLSKCGLTMQKITQLIQLNLLENTTFDELWKPRLRKTEEQNRLSLLSLAF